MNTPEIASTVRMLRDRLDGGLVAAVPVPFDAGGRFHARANEAYTTYMSRQPLAGVAVWAHTGRGLMLDAETAERVLTSWRDALPDRPVIAGVGAPASEAPDRATARSVRMAEEAARLGADAI